MRTNMIGVVSTGFGNVRSILNMLERADIDAFEIRTPAELNKAGKIILPGVGAFDTVIENFEKLGFADSLPDYVIEKRIPTLGICVGMQIMTHKSEEGVKNGLGWIDGECKRFDFSQDAALDVPHMRWNEVIDHSERFFNKEEFYKFYFLHSYYVELNLDTIKFETEYGFKFTSGFVYQNFVGVQFHPEKSHNYGIDFFRKFDKWEPNF